MVDAVTLVTVGGVTLLFFFWVYGIYAFVRDCRRVLPDLLAGLRAAWRERRRDDDEEAERAERKRQLF